MHYESLVEFPIMWQLVGTPDQMDLLTSLRGFQLRTEVVVSVNQPQGADYLDVTFREFRAKTIDDYDFNFQEYLTLPNPDHGSTSPLAVCPKKETIRVYHTNARRMENAGLAAPYHLESAAWDVKMPRVIGPGRVTL